MPITLAQLIEEQLGVKTSYRENPLVSQVAVTVTKVLPLNPNRLGITVMNMGANDIFLTPSNTVAVGMGIQIQSGGGGVSFNWKEDFELVGMDWHAIANGGVSDIYVLEIVAV